MHIAAFVTVVAIVVGFAVPTCANDRPSDPFGNHTIELNKEAPLVEMWESLRDQVLLDKAHFHSCIESNNESNNTDCAAVSLGRSFAQVGGRQTNHDCHNRYKRCDMHTQNAYAGPAPKRGTLQHSDDS